MKQKKNPLCKWRQNNVCLDTDTFKRHKSFLQWGFFRFQNAQNVRHILFYNYYNRTHAYYTHDGTLVIYIWETKMFRKQTAKRCYTVLPISFLTPLNKMFKLKFILKERNVKRIYYVLNLYPDPDICVNIFIYSKIHTLDFSKH